MTETVRKPLKKYKPPSLMVRQAKTSNKHQTTVTVEQMEDLQCRYLFGFENYLDPQLDNGIWVR